MYKSRLSAPGVLICLLFVCLVSLAGSKQLGIHRNAGGSYAASDCLDSAKDCKLPVKYLGQRNGCACFACEFGKKTQRVICTTDQSAKTELISKSKSKGSRKN